MTTPGTSPGHPERHICGPGVLKGVLLTVLLLMAVSVLVSRVDLGAGKSWIVLAIAVFQGLLVLSVFMHMIWDTTTNKIFFLGSFFFLALLLVFCFADLSARADVEPKNAREAPLEPWNG